MLPESVPCVQPPCHSPGHRPFATGSAPRPNISHQSRHTCLLGLVGCFALRHPPAHASFLRSFVDPAPTRPSLTNYPSSSRCGPGASNTRLGPTNMTTICIGPRALPWSRSMNQALLPAGNARLPKQPTQWTSLSLGHQALLQSQAGLFASRRFTTIPFSPHCHCLSHLFRVFLLRRLRLPLLLTARV